MIKKLLFPLLKIAYVGVANDGNRATIHTKYLTNNKVVKEESREFELVNSKPTQQMIEYIERVDKSSSYFYIAVILNSINQGSLPSTDEQFFAKLGIDTKNISTIKKDDQWTIYGSNFDIDEIKENYDEVGGVDFIFPTESIIDYLKSDSDESEAFMLYCNSSVSLSIYNSGLLVYSSHFIFRNDDEILVNEEDSGVSDLLDDMLVGDDILEEIVELDNINDDFDTIEDLNEFVADESAIDFDSIKDIDGDGSVDGGSHTDSYDFFDEENDGDLRKDMLLLEFIKNSINDFYKNGNLPSEFISNFTIYDTHKAAKGVARFIENELYIDTKVVDIDVAEIVSNMAIQEVRQ